MTLNLKFNKNGGEIDMKVFDRDIDVSTPFGDISQLSPVMQREVGFANECLNSKISSHRDAFRAANIASRLHNALEAVGLVLHDCRKHPITYRQRTEIVQFADMVIDLIDPITTSLNSPQFNNGDKLGESDGEHLAWAVKSIKLERNFVASGGTIDMQRDPVHNSPIVYDLEPVPRVPVVDLAPIPA